ncbi:MurR/RpiR family transcriptional regulator [Streptomyces zaomyceticus]|uniref:MurR/RpiR family transcriptional regulator n=1 Tax=Streptomyces zaomyceticus TaxID=68286 RepID=UPI0027E56AA7|nr:hypothetical protein [Streptomyces zaomyceticus]
MRAGRPSSRSTFTPSPVERRVARVLLAACPSVGLETVAAIADRAGVSAPTVLRFVACLGFAGFPDFPDFPTAHRESLNVRLPHAVRTRPGRADTQRVLRGWRRRNLGRRPSGRGRTRHRDPRTHHRARTHAPRHAARGHPLRRNRPRGH